MPAILNGQDKFTLKYLWTAYFADGTEFDQAQDDKSTLDPKRSAFYDLLQTNKPVIKFVLEGNGQKLSIDLLTGLFNLNGVDIVPENLPPLPGPYKLIFFRQHQQDLNIKIEIGKDLKPYDKSRQQGEHRIKYFIGWQFNYGGKNYKEVLGLI